MRLTTAPAPAPPGHAPPGSGTPTAPRTSGRVRPALLFLACPLIVLDNLWVVWMERVVAGPYVTTISLFGNAVFILAVLVGGNVLLRRRWPAVALSQAELLLVYCMVATGAAFAGLDGVSILITMMTHPVWFTNQPGREVYVGHLPEWALIADRTVLTGFFNGNDTFYRPRYLLAWAAPALIWTAFTTGLVFVMQCLNVLARQQWSDRERLTFPLTILPLEMTASGGALWRNRLMWAGLALAGGIDVLNGFAYLYPSLPSLPVTHVDISPQLTDKPWRAMGFTCYSFYPFAVGLGYLLPVDLLFSCWFFYFFWKAQLVASSAMGWDIMPEFPFVKQQAFGGILAIILFLVWISRRSLVLIWRRAVGPRRGGGEMDDAREGLPYRWALAGTLAGTAGLSWFFHLLGAPWWLAVVGVVLYYVVSVAITRIRAEFGPPVHDAHFSGPDSMLPVALGTVSFDARGLAALNWFWWFNRGYRNHPMPIGLEALRMADRVRASQRLFFWAIMLATVVGVLATFWAYGHLGYEYGVAGKFRSGTQHAAQGYNRLINWIQTSTQPNATANWATVAGFVVVSLLFLGRLNAQWWPFHPIGFVISASWSINLVWMPLFVAWAVKLLVLRYGGLRAYRLLMPFFLGLILGQTLVGCAWSLYGMALGVQTYSFWGG